MMMHGDEIPVGVDFVHRLLASQRPDISDLPITHVGGGTDNSIYRVGDDYLVRMPRTPDKAALLQKELRWLPDLGRVLHWRIPVALHAGRPTDDFPLPWAIYRWLDGETATDSVVEDWATYGRDLAGFVNDLHSAELMGASRGGELAGYRGGLLQPHEDWLARCLGNIRALDVALDVERLWRLWRDATGLAAPEHVHVWLHGDLRPTNVLVHGGRLHAVIDFGGLAVGYPDAEHAPTWDLPAAARDSYRAERDIDDRTWLRARAWALLMGASGVSYYWNSYPAFVEECLGRLREILQDAD